MTDLPHIVVMEDDRALATAIAKKLELSGFSVSKSDNVDQAIELVNSAERVDAIWLDHYLLGNKNGLDFLASLRGNTDGAHCEVPVYVVSNTATDDKVKSYLRLGAEKYYVKSDHSLEEIIHDIKQTVSKR